MRRFFRESLLTSEPAVRDVPDSPRGMRIFPAGLIIWLFCFSLNGYGQKFVRPNVVDVALAGTRFGQSPAPPEARYYRLICPVHLTGSGRHGDPRRPEFVPSDGKAERNGIIAWSMQATDDGNMAILHVVAASRKALDAILNDKRAEVKVFELGKHGKDAIETEMKRYKKDFNLEKFEVSAQ